LIVTGDPSSPATRAVCRSPGAVFTASRSPSLSLTTPQWAEVRTFHADCAPSAREFELVPIKDLGSWLFSNFHDPKMAREFPSPAKSQRHIELLAQKAAAIQGKPPSPPPAQATPVKAKPKLRKRSPP
jgi:hypothetical protein